MVQESQRVNLPKTMSKQNKSLDVQGSLTHTIVREKAILFKLVSVKKNVEN